MSPLNINIDGANYLEEISEELFAHMIKSGEYEEVQSDELSKAMETGNRAIIKEDLEGVTVVRSNGEKVMKVIKRKNVKPLKDVAMPEEKGVNKHDFSTDERKKLSTSGEAMPDGSYPVRNMQDLKDAIKAIGRSKDPAAAKAHIKRRANSLKLSHLIPDTWKSYNPEDEVFRKSFEELDILHKSRVGLVKKMVTDKNGKVTTKWIKASEGTNTPNKPKASAPSQDDVKSLYSHISQHGAIGKISYNQYERALQKHGVNSVVGDVHHEEIENRAYPNSVKRFTESDAGKELAKKHKVGTDSHSEGMELHPEFERINEEEQMKEARKLHGGYISGYTKTSINEKLIRGEHLSKNRFNELLDRHPESITSLGHMGKTYDSPDEYVMSVAFKRAENSEAGKKVLAAHVAEPNKNPYIDEWLMESKDGQKLYGAVKNEIYDRMYGDYLRGGIKLKHDEKVINAHFDEHDVAQ